jgi:hypothetical protein
MGGLGGSPQVSGVVDLVVYKGVTYYEERGLDKIDRTTFKQVKGSSVTGYVFFWRAFWRTVK